MYLPKYYLGKETILEEHQLKAIEEHQSYQSYQQSVQAIEDISSRLFNFFKTDKELIRQTVAQLPTEELKVIVMHFWHEQSFAKIAIALKKSEEEIKIIYITAIDRLKKKLLTYWVSSHRKELTQPKEMEAI
ncbi:MAG: hypothetical protein HQK49_17120 [Oligoflexia bacterium]|nr:hypothetical protein [Oligoflexia bacterium]